MRYVHATHGMDGRTVVARSPCIRMACVICAILHHADASSPVSSPMRTGQEVVTGIGMQERKDIAERMHRPREIRFAGLSVALVKGERRKRKCQRRMAAQHRHPCVFNLPYPSGIGERGRPLCSFANGRTSHGVSGRALLGDVPRSMLRDRLPHVACTQRISGLQRENGRHDTRRDIDDGNQRRAHEGPLPARRRIPSAQQTLADRIWRNRQATGSGGPMHCSRGRPLLVEAATDRPSAPSRMHVQRRPGRRSAR